ncbi:response regulator [Chitinophagaceae bacterium MMS25-I14]
MTPKTQHLLSRMLVIDNYKMIINGIKLLMGSSVSQFLTASDRETALQLAAEYKPELVIIDYVLPDTSGDTIVRDLRYKLPGCRILAYSFSFDQEAIMNMFYAGVNGYVLKTNDDEELLRAIDALMSGKEYFCLEARNQLINRLSNQSEHARYTIAGRDFTQKEIDIIKLICKEKTAKEISKEIFLSERTVEQYRNNITKRIGSRNIAGLIKFALRNGIVKLQDL